MGCPNLSESYSCPAAGDGSGQVPAQLRLRLRPVRHQLARGAGNGRSGCRARLRPRVRVRRRAAAQAAVLRPRRRALRARPHARPAREEGRGQGGRGQATARWWGHLELSERVELLSYKYTHKEVGRGRWYYISRDAEIGAAVVVFWEDDVEVVP
eukprot:1191387-Prorocentrum_minimum.AAC.1